MWPVNEPHSSTFRIITCLLLFAAFLSTAWLLASWAEQSRGLSFGPVFTVVSLLEVIVGLGVLLGMTEELQDSHDESMERKHTA